MTPEIKAAAERLRKWAGHDLRGIDWYDADLRTLADYALSLLDTELITDCYATDPANWRDKWLLSIGFRPDDEQDYLFINSGHSAMHDIQAMAAGPWRLADPEGFVEIPRPKTRGAVRTLLAALEPERDEGCRT